MQNISINRSKVVFINLTEMDEYNGLEANLKGGGRFSKTDMATRFLTSGTTTVSAMDTHHPTGKLICPEYRMQSTTMRWETTLMMFL